MRKLLVLIALFICCGCCYGQSPDEVKQQIDSVTTRLAPVYDHFEACLITSGIQQCITGLENVAHTGYEKWFAGSTLYEVDADKALPLNKAAWESQPGNFAFIIVYAEELERKGEYAQAATLYEKYAASIPEDFRVHVWLADCYMNMGKTDSAIARWKMADHGHNHTGIDMAIYAIYGGTAQYQERDRYRKEVEKGNPSALCSLIFLDMNWKGDWWNAGIRHPYLDADLALAKSKLKETDKDYRLIQAYVAFKKISEGEHPADSLKDVLLQNKLVINGNPLPQNGQIASDILRICFYTKVLSDSLFYRQRGADVLSLAKTTKDKELLNIYAYLQATVLGKVDPAIDKEGWREFKDERFAVSYFIGKGEQNRYDDKELAEAIADLPNSASLLWVKATCAKMENKPVKPILAELVKKEFKTLGSDRDHSSYQLNSYFHFLEDERE